MHKLGTGAGARSCIQKTSLMLGNGWVKKKGNAVEGMDGGKRAEEAKNESSEQDIYQKG